MQKAFTAWENYSWQIIVGNTSLVLDARKMRFHLASCPLLPNATLIARTWEDLVGFNTCAACSNDQTPYIRDTVENLVNMRKAVELSIFKEKPAHEVLFAAGEALYDTFLQEGFLRYWDPWKENLSELHLHLKALQNAFMEEAQHFYPPEQTRIKVERYVVFRYEVCKEVYAESPSARQAAFAGIVARGHLGQYKDTWLIRASLQEAVDVMHVDLSGYMTVDDPGVQDQTFWDTVLAFIHDGQTMEEAVETALAV